MSEQFGRTISVNEMTELIKLYQQINMGTTEEEEAPPPVATSRQPTSNLDIEEAPPPE